MRFHASFVAAILASSFVNSPAARGDEPILGRAPASIQIADSGVQVSRLRQAIESKEREIRLNEAELMAIELRNMTSVERDEQRQRLALANEVLHSEIEDLSLQRSRLQGGEPDRRVARSSGTTSF